LKKNSGEEFINALFSIGGEGSKRDEKEGDQLKAKHSMSLDQVQN